MKPRVFTLFAITLFTSESVISQSNPNSTDVRFPPNVESEPKTASNVTKNLENKAGNKTSLLPIYSEGGTIPARVSKPKDDKLVNSTNNLESKLMSLGTNVFGSETSVRSPIQGRKGVKYPMENFTNSEETDMKLKNTSNTALNFKYETKTIVLAPTKSMPSTEKLKNIVIETPKPIPKKPTKTISSDYAHNEGELEKNGLPINSSLTAASGRPNLVVPFVITAFALPLFAILGYYALKHGREAWKNRHYRRMDFLLDGMYND